MSTKQLKESNTTGTEVEIVFVKIDRLYILSRIRYPKLKRKPKENKKRKHSPRLGRMGAADRPIFLVRLGVCAGNSEVAS